MVNPLRRLTAKGFRSLEDVDVEFGAFSVLIGPNGSGKSNLLKVLSFVRDTARFDVRQAIDLAGGFQRVIRLDGTTKSITLGIEGMITKYAKTTSRDSYTLKLSATGTEISREETLKYKRVPGRGKRLTMHAGGRQVDIQSGANRKSSLQLSSEDISALGTLSKMNEDVLGPGPHEFFDFLGQIRYLDPVVHEARQSSRVAKTRLNDSASNLSAALFTLASEDPDSFDSVKRDLKICLPGLEDIVFESIGGSAISVVIKVVEKGLSSPIELADASFGTVRILALLVALHEADPPPLTIIEEVDHGLHPYALDVLVDRMREASARTQIIVASHSPTLVNRLQPEEIIICGRDSGTGASMIPATSTDDIAAAVSEGDWKAGELWFSGMLGGVPQ